MKQTLNGRARRLVEPVRGVITGVAAAVVVAVGARLAHTLLPDGVGAVLHEVVIAVAAGIAIAAVGVPAGWHAGLHVAAHRVLRAGIVLLGARIALDELVRLGGLALGVIVALMLVAGAVAAVMTRVTATPARTGTLIGVGVAVCGNSAIAAAAPTIGARQEQVSQAIAVNTLFGTLALFAYPVVGAMLGLSDPAFGMWAGTAINDTAQVVAAGFAHSDAAGEVATVVKLVRNALMAPVLVVLALAATRIGSGSTLAATDVRKAIPGFVVAFVALAVATSLGMVDAAARLTGLPVADAALTGARALILVGLAGVGLSTPPSALRQGGGRALLVGFVTSAAIAIVSLTVLSMTTVGG